MHQGRRHLLHLFVVKILPRHCSAINNFWIHWIGRGVIALSARCHWPPVHKIQRPPIASASRRSRAAVLLCPIHPIWKPIVRRHVIKLSGRLVVPGAPRLPAVPRHDYALIASQNHSLRVVRVYPQLVIIVAARRTLNCRKCFSAVPRSVHRRIRHIHHIRILRIHAHFAEVPAASPNPRIFRNALPVFPAVVRAVQPTLFRIGDQINPLRIAPRKRDSHPSQLFRRQPVSRQLLPMLPAILRTIEARPRPLRRWIDAPRRPPRLQQSCEHDLWIPRLHSQIDRPRIFVLEQHLLPRLPAIVRTKNSALLIRSISMSQRCHKNFLRVFGVHQNLRNLPRILQPDVLPRFSSVRRFIHPVPGRNARAHVRLARSHVNYVRIRRRHPNRPDRSDRLCVKYRIPGSPRVVRLPNTPIHRPEVVDVCLTGHSRDRQRPPRAERPDHPPVHSAKPLLVETLRPAPQRRLRRVHTHDHNSRKQQWQGTPQVIHVWSPDEKEYWIELRSITAARLPRSSLVAQCRIRRCSRGNHRSPQRFSRPIKTESAGDDNPPKRHSVHPENCFTPALHHRQAHQQEWKNSRHYRTGQPAGHPEPAL